MNPQSGRRYEHIVKKPQELSATMSEREIAALIDIVNQVFDERRAALAMRIKAEQDALLASTGMEVIARLAVNCVTTAISKELIDA